MDHSKLRCAAVITFAAAVTLVGNTVFAAGDVRPSTAPADLFEAPFRLRANGKIIDTGEAWGHCAPAVTDLNGDGKPDLVLGDFSGKFHRYLNVGSAKAPDFRDDGLLQAGGVTAEVWIYCCIGAQARFRDLDGNGIVDLLSNSYDPGYAYLFRGRPGNTFAAREEIHDKADVPVRYAPKQKRPVQSFGAFYEAVDWDADGDLDLLIGGFGGDLKLRINEGSATSPQFAVDNVDVQTAGGPLHVDKHLCPVVADWDGDGLWDIVAGCDDGSVTWFRNVGKRGAPAFAAGQTLVARHEGDNGYNVVSWDKAKVVPGIRSQPEVFDFNGDGKLDLLVGDFYTAYDFKPDLTDDQKIEVGKLIQDNADSGKAMAAKFEKMRKDFIARYPGDAINGDEAQKDWSAQYKALRESLEAKQSEAQEKFFAVKVRPFLASTHHDRDDAFNLAPAHGHVWVFIRK
jgi:hypothetical protein